MERPLPQDVEAERAIIGAILLDPKYLPVAVEKITAEDFFHFNHRLLFYCMLEMAKKDIPIDLRTIVDELEKEGELEAVGGAAYVSQLMDGIPHISNVEFYAKIVKDKSALRGLIHAAAAMQEQALSAADDPQTILGRAKATIDTLSREQTKTGLIAIEDIVRDSYDQISKSFDERNTITGLATGYGRLDNALAGLQASEFIVLAARPSMGKSSLALNIAENVASRKNIPVAVFSLEMSSYSLLMRLLCTVARIDSNKFRTGMLNAEERSRLVRTLATVSQIPLWIDDSSTVSMLEISAKAARLQREKGLGLVIVDYIQLVASPSKRQSSRQEEVSDISRGLKALAKDLKIPVIGLSQLTRAPEQENRRPQLADLRSSGAIEQDADVVLFIHRPNFYKKSKDLESPEERGVTELVIAKQRNGPIAEIQFIFQESITRFEERAPDGWDSGLGEST